MLIFKYLDLEMDRNGCTQTDYLLVPDLEVCQTWLCRKAMAVDDDDDDDDKFAKKPEKKEESYIITEDQKIIIGCVVALLALIVGLSVAYYYLVS